jgi:hypothetical protein
LQRFTLGAEAAHYEPARRNSAGNTTTKFRKLLKNGEKKYPKSFDFLKYFSLSEDEGHLRLKIEEALEKVLKTEAVVSSYSSLGQNIYIGQKPGNINLA